MGRNRMTADEAMRIAEVEDEYLSIGCDVERGDGYTVLTSDVCHDMWDANHVREIDLEHDADLDAFIDRMETLFRKMNREHCKFELDFRTRPQQLAALLRRRGYVCTRGVVQVYRGIASRRTGAGCLSSRVVEIPGQSEKFRQCGLADWTALERESYSAYDSGTGFAERAADFSRHRLECAWESGQDYRLFMALADGRSESGSEWGSSASCSAGVAVGKCELFRRRGVAKVESLYVMQTARGSGMGAALLNRAIDSAVTAGDDLIYLVAAAEDWPRHMYPRFGFLDLMETSSWLKMLDEGVNHTDLIVW